MGVSEGERARDVAALAGRGRPGAVVLAIVLAGAIARLVLAALVPITVDAAGLARGGRGCPPGGGGRAPRGRALDRASPAYLGDRPGAATYHDPAPQSRREPLLVVVVDGLGPGRERLEEKLGRLEPAGTFTAHDGAREVRRYRFYRRRSPDGR